MYGKKVCVIGLGYVGITLSAVLAEKGFYVLGIDINKKIIDKISRKEAHLFEPGIEGVIKRYLNKRIFVKDFYPKELPKIIIVCISTPVDLSTEKPDLRNLRSVIDENKNRISDGTLVIIRSTVPVGTSRNIALSELSHINDLRLAYCPERTIQGQALKELQELPQIIGGLNNESVESATALFKKITPTIVKMSSLEAAEMIKLICNSHTDLIYSYGNEVALMAEKFGLDPIELIRSANYKYPRPDLSLPGFVGGGCLTKDPYILIDSFSKFSYTPTLVKSARKLNEYVPVHIAKNIIERIDKTGKKIENFKIFILGFAYKGVPETDDTRGSPIEPFINYISKYTSNIYGHDYLVSKDKMREYGVISVSIEEGFKEADCVIFLNNNPRYLELDISYLIQLMKKPPILIDCWRIFGDSDKIKVKDLIYGGIGY